MEPVSKLLLSKLEKLALERSQLPLSLEPQSPPQSPPPSSLKSKKLAENEKEDDEDELAEVLEGV